MGIGVSSWRLARAVAQLGEYGFVSGTAIHSVMVRELQDGDPSGRIQALRSYPDPKIVEFLIDRFVRHVSCPVFIARPFGKSLLHHDRA